MAATAYTYSVSTDFTGLVSPYTQPALGRLSEEIQVSAIVTALDHIDLGGDVCKIWFKADLSAGDQTVLDGIVAAHTGEPLEDKTPTPVKVVENNLLDPDTSLSATDGHYLTVEADQDESELAISYPYEIDVLAARYWIPADDADVKDGDRFDILGIPGGDPFVGYLTQDAAQDATTVYVSETVFEYLRHGLDFKFGSHSKIYHIVASDSAAGTLTLSEGLAQAITVGDLIYVRRYMCRNLKPSKGTERTIGDLNPGSAGLCANAQIVAKYRPETQPTTAFVVGLELIYSY